MTAHKAQGKTLENCLVNLTGCHGTESPYVMLSRATSLEGLVILTPFSKDKICCRRSEDTRIEFRRLEYLALRTVMQYGTDTEASWASEVIERSYGAGAQAREPPVVRTEGVDAGKAVNRLQRANAVLTAPIAPIRRGKLPVTTSGIAASASLDASDASSAGPSLS
ncbi:hypothetical protein FB451DRAFT_1413361 [Mycena latifolia]|nr:hypothetical protein FB451DRAFT_1413361 [Mycena latifolia]